jgi:molybdenum cofactor cytidylyltransferase
MTATDTGLIGGILLAAGGSSRMGHPKQLIEFEGTTLIRRAASHLANSVCDPCVVVLGSDADACERELSGVNIDICVNPDPASGMSTSLKAGLTTVLEIDQDISAVVVTLCDQPYITSDIIDHLAAEYCRIRPSIVASEYNEISGVPALFSREMFDEIYKLEGDEGARQLIRSAGDRVLRIAQPLAAFDIDSPHDLTSVGETNR